MALRPIRIRQRGGSVGLSEEGSLGPAASIRGVIEQALNCFRAWNNECKRLPAFRAPPGGKAWIHWEFWHFAVRWYIFLPIASARSFVFGNTPF